MAKSFKTSIIIPVKNNEYDLNSCLDSILACDLNDCEIILSLGDSRDRSEDICRVYQSAYPSIRLIRQDGKGLSNARNCAMAAADGNYIVFLDADDHVDSTVFGSVLQRLRDGGLSADVIVTDFYQQEYPSQKIIPYFQIGSSLDGCTGMEHLPEMLKRRQCFWNVWRFIYRRDFLEHHHLRFAENMMSEDVDYTIRVLIAEPEIAFIHSPYYYYHVGKGGSLMDRPTRERLSDTVTILTSCIQLLRNSAFPYADKVAAQLQFEYILNMALIVEIEEIDRNAAASLYGNWKSVLYNSSDPAVKLGSAALSVIGLIPMAHLLHGLKMIRRRMLGREVKKA